MRRLSYLLYSAILCSALSTPGVAQESGDSSQTIHKTGPVRQKGKHLGRRFQEMDLDHDGKISRSEWKGKEQAFDRIDVDHDGFITLDEFKNARQHHRRRQTPEARQEESVPDKPLEN
ncbi:MAG: hypothetical protein DMG06_15835 [Acidobacteria bacterium]|nr:MAG: hypothetical protein DMG06_15835 [Acidobacteriota bacterium]